jgi:hypothetical protein
VLNVRGTINQSGVTVKGHIGEAAHTPDLDGIPTRFTEHEVMQHALTDIDWLLREGFDTNTDDCEIDGVKDTIDNLKQYINCKQYARSRDRE